MASHGHTRNIRVVFGARPFCRGVVAHDPRLTGECLRGAGREASGRQTTHGDREWRLWRSAPSDVRWVCPLLVGMPLWLESYAAALLASVPIGTLVVRIIVEEQFLRRALAGYNAYTERVQYRLIPFVW